MGTPYAVSSDLVSAWPAKSLAVATYVDAYKTDLAMVQNPQTGTTYGLVALDTTKLVTLSNAGAVTVTLPLEVTVPWAAYTQLRLMNIGAGTVTVAGAVGVTINGSPLTLTTSKGATLVKTAVNTWTFLPFSSGAGAAAVTGTTGSPTITPYTLSLVNYVSYRFLGTGTISLTGGLVDVLAVGGGGGGGGSGSADWCGGGGAGGYVSLGSFYVPTGTYTLTVGAGGGLGANGTDTTGLGLTAYGGTYGSGVYGSSSAIGRGGQGSGGGATGLLTTAGGVRGGAGQGFAGGTSSAATNAGGGGGSSAAGANNGAPAAGGAGTANIIAAGTSVTYAAGGQGRNTAGTAGPANTGNGGTFNALSGGSGIYIVRVIV